MRLFFRHVWVAIIGRCPRCFRGRIFRSLLKMNDHCPVCGLQFEREYGYFLMSIFIAYLIDGIILVPLGIYMVRNQVDTVSTTSVLLLILVVVTPISFRYSRIVWLHIDHYLDPLNK